MPDVTWSRMLPEMLPWIWESVGLEKYGEFGVTPIDSGNIVYSNASQVTTSWRTSKALEDHGAVYEQESTADILKGLAHESKHQSDFGNEFHTSLDGAVTVSHPRVSLYDDSEHHTRAARYTGPLYPEPYPPFMRGPLDEQLFSNEQILLDGAAAFRLAAPTRPHASLAQFLGECREKLPALVGVELMKKGLVPKAVGGEALNIQFGIVPFISDIKKMCAAVLKSSEIIAGYVKNSDKPVHRKRTLVEERTIIDNGLSSQQHLVVGYPGTSQYFDQIVAHQGVTNCSDLLERKVWFSGSYTYHLSQAHDYLSKMASYEDQANVLIGVDITPQLIWELTPWSWLIDWFGNFSGFLTSMSLLASDDLVLQWGYIMHRVLCTRILSTTGLQPNYPNSGLPSSVSSLVVYHSKIRTQAHPYGFGLNVPELNPVRLAILAALGISHGPKHLGL